MDEKRKTIIIKEIMTWKENRMLPEQYCDYLLTLYTEGDHPQQSNSKKSKKYFRSNLFFRSC